MDDTQRAAISEKCRNLVVALGFHGDHRDPASAVALFAEDGSWRRGGRNYVGREEIAGSYAHGSPTAVTRHINASPMITVIDEDHAEGKSYYLAVQDNPGDPDAKPPFALRLFSMGITTTRSCAPRTAGGSRPGRRCGFSGAASRARFTGTRQSSSIASSG